MKTFTASRVAPEDVHDRRAALSGHADAVNVREDEVAFGDHGLDLGVEVRKLLGQARDERL